MGGELLGTFNPDTYTWESFSSGAWMETSRFLYMAATENGRAGLQALNIPCIEIGKANLSGSGGNGGALTVNMVDTTFFSYTNGAPPRIWASGNVNGTDSGSYGSSHNGYSIPLAGSDTTANLSADFMVNSFSATPGDAWNATVEFNSGSTVGPTGTEYNVSGSVGGAAGLIGTEGSFSGTATGVAREPVD